MNKIFAKIGSMVERYPFKTLLGILLVFAIFIGAGVPNVRMATGNDTLVQTDNEVYISNDEMESSFGGESILVMFKDESGGNLLSQENIRKMWNVEKKLQYEENIFSFMSPASMVHQITETQSEYLKEQILTLSDGLGEMSTKMIQIGEELGSKKMMNPSEIEKKLSDLSSSTAIFGELIEGQNNLTKASKQLEGGLGNASNGLLEVSKQLKQLSSSVDQNQQLSMQLNTIADNIEKSAQGIATMGKNTQNIEQGTQNTSTALEKIQGNLSSQASAIQRDLNSIDMIEPDQLKEMASGFVTMGENLGSMSEGLQTFHGKSEMMIADIPSSQEELDAILYEEDSELRSVFSDVVLDDKNAFMVIKLEGNLRDETLAQISQDVEDAIENEKFETLSVIVSGKPVLDTALKSEMRSNMITMISMAIVIMLIVLTIVFKVKWRMLSLGVILISVIATIGLMSILNVPITMVSMAVFPILIGLGIDYSIQFHNRYHEEKSVRRTITQIGKAVAVAVIATMLGFVSLYSSPVPMIQDFGNMLSIGVVIAFIGSIFILMPILYIKDNLTIKHGKTVSKGDNAPRKAGFLNKMLIFITMKVIKFKIPVLIIVIAFAIGGFMVDGKVEVETNIESFMPQDMEALVDIREIREVRGSTDQITLYMKDDNILTQENIQWIQDKGEKLQKDYDGLITDIKSIDSVVSDLAGDENLSHGEYVDRIDDLPEGQSRMFINQDRTESVMLLNIAHLDTNTLEKFVGDLRTEVKDSPMDIKVTGKSVLDVEMVHGLTEGRIQMTMLGLALVFVALLIIYRNLFKALIPILPVGFIVGMSSGVMYLLGIKFTPITSTIGALILGMGTQMMVMFLERYIEERKSGNSPQDSMLITANLIGKAIIASGLTTVGGFSVLMASAFVILKDFGFMTVVNISLALLSTFIVLPALIILLDRFLFSKKEKQEMGNKTV